MVTIGIPRPIAKSIITWRRFSALLFETELVLAILYNRRLMTKDAAKIPCGTAKLIRTTAIVLSLTSAFTSKIVTHLYRTTPEPSRAHYSSKY